MKTLKIVFAATLLICSIDSYAETCNPCILNGSVKHDSITIINESIPSDMHVNALLQQMTSAAHNQLVNSPGIFVKSNKQGKKKANG
jgi:hypothetical protein